MAWYPTPGWMKRKPITIDNTKVSGASHTSFPVLISRTDADIKAGAQAGGDDILFTSADGTTKLDHEIEKWDSGTGELVAWVRIPTLSGSVDTDIYVYYGNPSATDQQNPTGVWDSFYKGVWHLGESSGPPLDSTSNNNDGTHINAPIQGAVGQIDGAVEYNGSDEYSDFGDSVDWDFLSGDFHIRGWFQVDSQPGLNLSAELIGRKPFASKAWRLNYFDDVGVKKLWFFWSTNGSNEFNLNPAWTATLGVKYRVDVVRISTSLKMYVDKVEIGSTAIAGSIFDSSEVLVMGGDNASYWLDGILDEARISKGIGRSVDWVATSYDNEDSPGTFYSVGAEEELSIETTLNRISGVLDRTASGVLVRVAIP